MDILNLISYTDSLFDIICNLKTEETSVLLKMKLEDALRHESKKGKYDMSKDTNEYEKQIVKLEAEV